MTETLENLPYLSNFRDFGGMPTASGGRVRRDRLYRSAHLVGIDPDRLAAHLDRDFAVIVDLRYADERTKNPSPWPADYADRILLRLARDGDGADLAPHHAMFETARRGPAAIGDAYAELYAALPFEAGYRALFAQAVLSMADGEGRTLVHCTAGKDRTGLFAALVLSTLGVAMDDILVDYLATANALKAEGLTANTDPRRRDAAFADLTVEAVEALLGVDATYIEAAFAAIRDRCGSLARYWADAGVEAQTLDRLRTRLVETADAPE